MVSVEDRSGGGLVGCKGSGGKLEPKTLGKYCGRASCEVSGNVACGVAGEVARGSSPSTGQFVRKVPGGRVLWLPPCCGGPRRKFVFAVVEL